MISKTIKGTLVSSKTLKATIPRFPSPIKTTNDITTISTRLHIFDKTNMNINLYGIESNIVENPSFEGDVANCIPEKWGGDWLCQPPDSTKHDLYFTPNFHIYGSMSNNKMARSFSPVKTEGAGGNFPNVLIFSDFFDVVHSYEYTIEFHALSINGRATYKYPKEEIYQGSVIEVTEYGEYQKVTIPPSNIKNNDWKEYIIEPIYGGFISWYDSSNNRIISDLIGVKRGSTKKGDSDSNAEIIGWETFSRTAISPYNAAKARICIFDHPVTIPSISYRDDGFKDETMSLTRPTIHIDNISVTRTNSYISKHFPTGSDSKINIDSQSIMRIIPPNVETSENYIIFDADDIQTGFYEVTGRESEISEFGVKHLKVGKETNELVWQSWIPFTANFSTLTSGARLTSATLLATASTSQPITPGKNCAISSGMEDARGTLTQPTTWAQLKGKTAVLPETQVMTESWVAGEQYEIDVTNSAKKFLAPDGNIVWGEEPNWKPIAVMLRDAGSNDGMYRTIASVAHETYDSPKLKIGYEYARYLEESYTSKITSKYPYSSEPYAKPIPIGGDNTIGVQRALYYFDTREIPSHAIVNSVKLRMNQIAKQSTGTNSIGVYMMDTTWDWITASWRKKYGTKNWSIPGIGGDDGLKGENLIAFLEVPKTEIVAWREFNFNTAGKNRVQEIISGTKDNCGFLVKSTLEPNNIITNFTSSVWMDGGDSVAEYAKSRPRLIVETNLGTYTLYNKQKYSFTPPGDDPEPPEVGITPIELKKTQALSSRNTFNYNIQSPINTNRYILIATGWSGGNSQWGKDAYFTSLNFNGVAMTKIAEVKSDESNSQLWGLIVPNSWQNGYGTNYVINGIKAKDGMVNILIREFINVNRTTPVYRTYAGRNNVNSAIIHKDGGVIIGYIAGGWVSDVIFLDNSNSAIGLPRSTENQQNDYVEWQRGYSSYKSIPVNTSGNVNINWSWNRIPGEEYMSSGAESAMCAVSLRPV